MTKYENEAFCCVRETEGAKQIGIYKITTSGQVSNLQTVKIDLEPVFFDYDGLNNEIILALGTNAAGQNSSRFEIYRFPADSKTIPGPVVLNHEGNIFDILKIDDNIYVFSNYRIYADTDGKTYTAPAHPNLLIDQISPDGKIVRRRIESQRNLVGLKAVKLSSTNIVLSGVFSEFMSDVSNLKAKPLFYIQLDGKMNPVFRNWHD